MPTQENTASHSLDALLRIVTNPETHKAKVAEFIDRQRAAAEAEAHAATATERLRADTKAARESLDRDRAAFDAERRQELAAIEEARAAVEREAEANRLRTEELNREQRRLDSRHAGVSRVAAKLVDLGRAATEAMREI